MTDTLLPFPDAPTPRTLDDALRMLAETRRLLDERNIARRLAPEPRTLVNALDQLAVDRETLAQVLRQQAAGDAT